MHFSKFFSLLSILATTAVFAETPKTPVLTCGEYKIFQDTPTERTGASELLKSTVTSSAYDVVGTNGGGSQLSVTITNRGDVQLMTPNVDGQGTEFVVYAFKRAGRDFAYSTLNGEVVDCE